MIQRDKKNLVYLLFFICSCCFFTMAQASDFDPANPTMEDYYKTPAYISTAEEPSVMLILDSSGSMNSLAYRGNSVRSRRPGSWSCSSSARGGDFDPLNDYYGHFASDTYYTYNNTDTNNQFFETCSGTDCSNEAITWSGNFLNWLTMRRIDIAKQVLTGGKVDTSGTAHIDTREAEPNPDRDFYKVYNDSAQVTDLNGNTRHMTPWHHNLFTRAYNASPQYMRFYQPTINTACGSNTYDARSSSALTLNSNNYFHLRSKVPSDKLVNGTVEGVVQQAGTDIRFGLTIFDGSDGPDWNGGEVRNYVGTINSDMVQAINDVHPNSWTPLAETLWTVTGYFAQNTSNTDGSGPHYESDSYTINNTWDPFYFNNKGTKIPCSEAFVILLTDGESTKDLNIPSWLRDYDNDGVSRGSFGSDGSDYLDDVAFFAHTNDLRPDATEPEMVGDQTITFYPVFAFGSGAGLLERAAINGGFTDRNGDARPNTPTEEAAITDLTKREWDHDDDGVPDNYADAENGSDLVDALQKAIGNIRKRMASGTAASVISSSRSGEGAVYQAVFFPTRADGENREVTWTGDTHSLLIDAFGNMREDTLRNNKLDMIDDYIVQMFFDDTSNSTKARRYKDLNGDGNLDVAEDIDGDGCLDVKETDHDGDGHFDVIEDKNGDGDCNDDEDYDNDGNLDVIEIDVDGDGNADINEDVDGDGYLDRGEDVICNGNLDDSEIDNNGNGLLDEDEDLDGDGHRDTVNEDLDGDCNFDIIDEDLDGDNHFDAIDEDLNANGLFDLDLDFDGDGDCTDAIGDVDTNGNGSCDTYEDLDGDNHFDRGEDLDGDNHFDRGEDLDGDNHFDRGEDLNCNGSLEDREDIDNDGTFDVDEDLNGNGSLDGSEDLDTDNKLDVGEDTNCNGILDGGETDSNGNGALDLDEDVDNDGHLDVIETDVDGDSHADVREDLDADTHLDRGEDLNCNGVIDGAEDANGDGILSDTEDLDGDGHFDKYNEDINSDGNLDVYEDTDNDGHLDLYEDLDGDGRFEDICEEDTNNDGILDAGEDLDGDGFRDCGWDLNADGDCTDPGEQLIGTTCHRDEDFDNDGRADVFEDVDMDGVLDLVEDINHNGIFDPGEDLNANGVFDLKEDLDNDGTIDVNEDLDGDTTWDFVHEDIDNDCNLDVLEDLDGDGKLDTINEDLDGDGHLDDTYEDSNGNCLIDVGTEDQDGDGHLDIREWDIDGDGRADGHEDLDDDCNLDVLEDLDGDGKLDTVNEDGSDGSVPDGILDLAETDVDNDGSCDLVADINYDTGPGCDGGSPKFDTTNEDLDGDGFLDVAEPVIDIVEVMNLKYLWSAGENLADLSMNPVTSPTSYGTSSPERYIFTFIDEDNDGIVDAGEVKDFDSSTLAHDPYFGYFLGTNTGTDRDINADGNVDNNDVSTLIDFIRGKDFPAIPTIRSRQLRIDTDNNGVENASDSVVTWRLGDIIQSTPTVVQSPAENYDLLYKNESYRLFKKAYAKRRTVVLSGSNDGLFHGFNGGFYVDKHTDQSTPPVITENKFWLNCYTDASYQSVCNDPASSPKLGQELWAYAPYNLLPHLQWLTRHNYTHVYYTDLKPKVFDAQLWPDSATDSVHVGGWGTVMIAGMRFGGGPIEINAAEGDGGTDTRTLRSAYFVLDITDPELPPALLGEFVVDEDSRFSFTTLFPAVIPVYDTNAPFNSWGAQVPLEWYFILGNGPTNLDGESKQEGQVFAMKLKNYQCNGQGINCTNKTLGTWEDNGRSNGSNYLFKLGEPNSFMGDPVVVDYQLGNPDRYTGAFAADAAYFGTVAGNFKNDDLDSDIGEDLNSDGILDYGEDANGNGKLDVDEDLDGDSNLDPLEDVGGWTGRLHRIVIDDMVASTGPVSTDPDTWTHGLFYDAKRPIIANPTVGVDEAGTFWVYFGTGRLFDTIDREDASPMNFYGISEPRDISPTLGDFPNYIGTMTTPARNSADLLNTTAIKVYEADTETLAVVTGGPAGVTDFSELEAQFDYDLSGSTPVPPTYDGYLVNLTSHRERNLGRAALLGDVVTFTSYTPSSEVCASEGSSTLYAYYYRTGTAYWTSVIGVNDSVTYTIGGEPAPLVENTMDLGVGLSLSPNIFTGRGEGSKAFIQTSTGAIQELEQANPGIVKSGETSWQQAE